MNLAFLIYAVILVAILAVAGSAIRVMREYQRAVMFTFGRFTGVKGPGLFLLVPYAQQMVRVDLRTVVLDVPSQDVISRDNVSVKVNAVLYFRVVDADKAVIQIENFLQATSTTRHRLCGHFTTRLRRHVTQGWTTTPRKVSDVRHYGVDVSAVGAGMAGTTANFELRQTDGIHMPFDSDSIDLVVSNQLMEHLH